MKKLLLLLFCYIPNFIFAQTNFEKQFSEFDKVISKDAPKAMSILNTIEKKKEFINDTLKILFYHKKGKYYYYNQNLDSAKWYFEKSLKLSLNIKLYKDLGSVYHGLAEIFSTENDIDKALIYDSTALFYAQTANNVKLGNIIIVSIARKLRYKGEFERSNKILFESLKKIPTTDPETYGVALATVAINYDDLGLSELTEEYYLRANEYLKKAGNFRLVSLNISNLAGLFNTNENYEKALIYADSILLFSDFRDSKIFYHLRKAEAYKGLKRWEQAIKNINSVLELDKEANDIYGYATDLILKGQIYKEKTDFKKALSIFKESKDLFEKNKIDDLEMQVQLYRDYMLCYLKENKLYLANDFENYINANERLSNQSIDKNITELEAKYNFQEKRVRITQQKLEIEKQKEIRNLSLGGGGILLCIVGAGFLWYREQQKRKALITQNELLSLKQNFAIMELSQINQQLTPHEFKNLLATISPQIQEKAPEAYKRMLQLLNVIKPSLQSAGFTETIEQQVSQVEDYLAIMQQSLMEPLTYSVENQLEDSVEFPRLLLKNLTENAIKHGIKGKSAGGEIIIKFYKQHDFNYLEVEDNGKGRTLSLDDSNALGLSSYQKLFKILNNKNNLKATLEVIDKTEGVKVVVKIPSHYNYS